MELYAKRKRKRKGRGREKGRERAMKDWEEAVREGRKGERFRDLEDEY